MTCSTVVIAARRLTLPLAVIIGFTAGCVSNEPQPRDHSDERAARLARVDPELRAPLVTLFPDGMRPVTAANLAVFRSASSAFQVPALPSPAVSTRYIRGTNGEPDVRLFVIEPPVTGDETRGAVIFMHGGGYVLGAPDSNLARLQTMANQHGCVVVAPQYRLAPETPFPGALEDNYAALKWVHTHAPMLRVDRSKLIVMGDSAGGGHAAALAIAARERGEVPVALQILSYPMLDDRTGADANVIASKGGLLWDGASNRFGWSAYLGQPAGGDSAPVGAVPARSVDLSDLPPTWIGVGDLDLFAEENLAYASRLIAAGVPTEVVVVPGAYHAFDVIAPNASASQRYTASWNRALARALGSDTD
ncbi:MAG: alpha/beta hydrolase [Pseudomonadota bacterium]